MIFRHAWRFHPTTSLFIPVLLTGLLGFVLPGCSNKTPGTTDGAAGAQPEVVSAAPALPPTQGTAEEVLARMVGAYKSATSYRDAAVLEVSGTQGGERQTMPFPCSLVVQRPNLIRMQIDNGTILCDGANLYGFCGELPGQVLKNPAPAQLSIKSLYPDRLLAASMMQSPAQSFSWAPLQLVLLLANDPMKTLTLDSQGLSLLEPAMVEGHACDRVQMLTDNGPSVLWIDQATSVLRRFEMPSNALRRQAEAAQVLDPTQIVEFRQAELNPQIAPEAFQFQLPDGMETSDNLVMPLLQVLGKLCPDFQFTDLEGNTTALSALRDKVVVMQLWTSKSVLCRPVLQAGSKALADLKNPEDVVVMAVCLEGSNVQNASLQTVLKDWDVALPIYRDAEQAVAQHYGISAVPVTIVVGKNGNVQSLQAGPVENMDALLVAVIERLQRGEDVYRSAFTQFETERTAFNTMVDRCVADDIYCFRPMIPQTEISPRTEPAKLKATKLWTCDRLKHPGNFTIVPVDGGSPKTLVVDDARSVVELAADGSIVASHALELQGNELVTVLNTAVGADGKRYFLGASRGVQRVHLFDEDFKTLLVYPEGQHPGIWDAHLTDLDGDGVLEMLLAYGGPAGVHAVDLQGKRLWHDNSMVDAFRIACLSPDGEGRRNTLALNGGVGGGNLIELDFQGRRVREISVAGNAVGWVVADELSAASGTSNICVLAAALPAEGQPAAGSIDALGIDAGGQVLWRHPVPQGVHRELIEPVVVGNVFPGGPKQWLIAAADGTITVVAADGQMVDRFAYGAELSGLATTDWDGKPVLLVSTPKAVEAWQIESSAASNSP